MLRSEIVIFSSADHTVFCPFAESMHCSVGQYGDDSTEANLVLYLAKTMMSPAMHQT